MAVGEGGGELAKQLVGRTYDMAMPGVICVYLTGRLNPGVGPHDVALALVGATYANGYVKNKVMEFVGPGVASLSADCRNGIDCMTTETTCWSSIWQTDGVTEEYLAGHGRADAYKELKPADVAYYDGCIELDLSKIECMIALPMHPSYAYPIRELKANAKDLLHEIETRANEQLSGKVKMDLVSKVRADGSIYVDQGIVAGCSGGTYENLCAVADILRGKSCGNGEFKFSAYPDSMPTYLSWSRTAWWPISFSLAASSANASAAPASAQVIPRPMASSASATPPAISPTAKAPSPARVKSPAWR